jgi:hypothetical protein
MISDAVISRNTNRYPTHDVLKEMRIGIGGQIQNVEQEGQIE